MPAVASASSSSAPAALPAEGTVAQALVKNIQAFGAFVEIDGCRTHALVHISQLAPRRVETVEDVVNIGDTVKVKVISVETAENGRSKVSLSMKQVDQATGQDLGGGAGGGGGDDPRRKRAERSI